MNITGFFKKNWIHFAILTSFIVAMYAYFSVQFDGYGLKQHDVEQFKGMSNEIYHYRQDTGKEPLWTNSMFGGMPATQISVVYKGNIFKQTITAFMNLFPSPAGIFLLHLIGFYILGMCMRLKPLIAALGAFAFAFASYEIVILQAGHNSKAMAVALMPPVLGAFIMAFRRNWKWGAALSALFMAFQLSMNHLQVTYYLGIVLFFVGAYFLIDAIKDKKIKSFGITAGAVFGAYLLALLVNYGNISLTNEYSKSTIRGGNDLKLDVNGEPLTVSSTGLDREYITNWSYGKGESFTLVSPYVKGSHSGHISQSKFQDLVKDSDRPRAEKKSIMEAPFGLYYGEQPFTSGPVYLGVLVVFLALLGLVFLDGKLKWALFAVSVIALLLSWGKNFMGFTDFFIDYVPGYNKFRTVTIILVVLELCLPVIGILLLEKLWSEREKLKDLQKKFLIVSGCFIVLLLGLKFVGLGDNYTSSKEVVQMDEETLRLTETNNLFNMPAQELSKYGIDKNNPEQMQQVIDAQIQQKQDGYDGTRSLRADIFSASTTRSLLFGFAAIGIVALFFYTSIPSMVIVLGLIVLQFMDLVPVDRNYLHDEDVKGKYVHWTPRAETLYPVSSNQNDNQILNSEITANPTLAKVIADAEGKGKADAKERGYTSSQRKNVIDSYKFQALNMATNYRVYEKDGFFQSSRASYFHKSIGGYHGAKLRNIQNVYEHHLTTGNMRVYDMLNVKYFIDGNKVSGNPTALGNAWLVREVKEFDTPDDEIRGLGTKLTVVNKGNGKLICNGETKASFADVSNGQLVQYIRKAGDTLNVPLNTGVDVGLDGYFVADTNGNSGIIPKATLDIDSVGSFTELAVVSLNSTFDPVNEAVMLKSEAQNLTSKKYSAKGFVKMTSYAPNKISYDADVDGKQLVVFSEIYYKDGWKAFVDGKEQNILKVNYLLRGLEIEGGKHKIEFVFDQPSYHTAGTMAYIGSFLILLLIGGVGYMDFKKHNLGSKSVD